MANIERYPSEASKYNSAIYDDDLKSEPSSSPRVRKSQIADKENSLKSAEGLYIKTNNLEAIRGRIDSPKIRLELNEMHNNRPGSVNQKSVVNPKSVVSTSYRHASEDTRKKTFTQSVNMSPTRTQQPHQFYSVPTEGMERNLAAANQFKLNQNDIVIAVKEPCRRGSLMSKSTYYLLEGTDREGPFKVTRSHDDFIKIRTILVKRWPGCYVPCVPPKRMLKKSTEKFIEERRNELEMFAQKMTELPHLHYSKEYQQFLKSSNDLDIDMIPFQKVNMEDIILRYKTIFKQSLSMRAGPDAEKKILEFKDFLKKVQKNFKLFKKVLKKTVQARKAYCEQLLSFHAIMSGGYEKDILNKLEKDPSGKPTYSSESENLGGRVLGIKQASRNSSIEYLYAWIKAEAREIGAVLEAIDQKDIYSTKSKKSQDKWTSSSKSLENTIAGKTSFSSMLSRKSKEDQIADLENKTAQLDKEAKQSKILYDCTVLILAHSEIDRFRERKSEQYHHVVNLAAQRELNNLHDLCDYWMTILTIENSHKSPYIPEHSESGL